MTIVKSIGEISIMPARVGLTIAENHHDGSCLDSIAARLLFTAQLIVGTIALPIILVLGLIATIVSAFQCEGKESLREMVTELKMNLTVLPLSILGMIAPLSTTNCVKDCVLGCLFGEN